MALYCQRLVGQGNYGVIYKGVLPDCKIVAIKKCDLVHASQSEKFISELDILSCINHRIIVKITIVRRHVPTQKHKLISGKPKQIYVVISNSGLR